MIRRFNRFELKYIVDHRLRDVLVEEMLLNMRPDSHGDGAGAYRVSSLYYDSADHACFWAKIEGLKYRRKLRVRVYGEDTAGDDVTGMVEIKQRINRTVQKRRVALPLNDAYALIEQGADFSWEDDRDRAVAHEVVSLVGSLHLQPACVISYLRQAFVGGDYETGLRITFDSELSCRGPEYGLGAGAPKHFFISPDIMVMEVKVNDTVPLWVARMLNRHNCQLQRISKYCAGIARLAALPYADLAETIAAEGL